MNRSDKILCIVPYKIFPAHMGGQKGIALFYHYFSQLVSLTCLTTKNNISSEPYPILNQLSNSSFRYINPFFFFQLKRLVVKDNFQFILFEHPYFAWLIVLLRKFSSVKIIIHSHNIESERFRSIGKWWWKILWHYEKNAYQAAHAVWFKTDEDKHFAIQHFKLSPTNCETIPYGISNDNLPTEKEIEQAKDEVCRQHQLEKSTKLILFNGTLSYKPNLDALLHILHDINPILLASSVDYKILICGKSLPASMNELIDYKDEHIVYCGFVDDIDLYFKACDVFINPLQDGGGIKTKLVEALGFGKPCVSSINGAIGVHPNCTNNRLDIIQDNDWNAFCNAILSNMNKEFTDSNENFYASFSWKNIATKAMKSLPR